MKGLYWSVKTISPADVLYLWSVATCIGSGKYEVLRVTCKINYFCRYCKRFPFLIHLGLFIHSWHSEKLKRKRNSWKNCHSFVTIFCYLFNLIRVANRPSSRLDHSRVDLFDLTWRHVMITGNRITWKKKQVEVVSIQWWTHF